MKALADETIHLTLSLIIGTVLAIIFGNWSAILAAIATGSLIDLDHFIDYLIYTKFHRFSLKEFLAGDFFNDFGKAYVFFHGFEYGIVFIVFGAIFPDYGWLFYSLGFSNLLHLFYDTITNKPIWPTYFITYRIAKNFDHKSFDFKCDK